MSVPPSDSPFPGSSTADAAGDPDTPPPQSVPDAPPIFVQTSSVGDSAAPVDKLGFDLYVNALADFLVAPNTRAPLTCSIEGSWGSGKSSFMLQLRNRLKTIAPNSRSIEFNAWKYDKQEELWAAFALNLTRSLRRQSPAIRRFLGDCKLYFSRIKSLAEALKLATFALAWLTILIGAGFIFVTFIRESKDGRAAAVKQAIQDLSGPAKPGDSTAGSKPAPPPVTVTAPVEPTAAQKAQLHDIHYWLGESTWAGAAIVVLALLWKLPESLRKRLFSTQIEQYIDKPDYKGKAAFLDTFSQDFARTVRAYSHSPDAKIFVFIDDLDRCEAPKAADLMQAINLLIGDGNSLIFILGLDRAKVAAAIAFKFREIIPYLDPSLQPTGDPAATRSFGDAFLEKFIQLSFRLPISSNESQARTFIDSLIGVPSDAAQAKSSPSISASSNPASPTAAESLAAQAESALQALRIESGTESQRIKDIVMMVREVLDYSPRRIKTFLNAFRLALYIASAQGLLDIDSTTGEAEVTPEQLGKFLAISLRYPDMRIDLASNSTFLATLEGLCTGEIGDEPSTTLLDPISRDMQTAIQNRWGGRKGIIHLFSYTPKEMDPGTWRMTYSLRDFPFQKFDTILPAVAPPQDPRRQEAPQSPIATTESSGATPGRSEKKSRYNNPLAEFGYLFEDGTAGSKSAAEPEPAAAISPADRSQTSSEEDSAYSTALYREFSEKLSNPNAKFEDVLPGAAALHDQLVAEGRIPPASTSPSFGSKVPSPKPAPVRPPEPPRKSSSATGNAAAPVKAKPIRQAKKK